MANTQTTVPLFVANQVLTAAQQNASAGTGVPVFATTVTRDAAFGGSNKALAEGQLCYIEASNIVQYYDGAAWATVGPSTASGLTFITSGTLTSSTSHGIDNCFSATYSNYRVILSEISASGSGTESYLRMRVGGVNATGANYSYQCLRFYTTSSNQYANDSASGVQMWASGTTATNKLGSCVFDIMNPFATSATNVLGSSHTYQNDAASYFGTWTTGSLANATSYDGFNIYQTTTTTAFKYKIYGYQNS